MYFLFFFFAFFFFFFFFFNDTATTEIYTLSLHDALPIFVGGRQLEQLLLERAGGAVVHVPADVVVEDRKSTRLNSSHLVISYAVFCLKKKKKYKNAIPQKKKKTKKIQ